MLTYNEQSLRYRLFENSPWWIACYSVITTLILYEEVGEFKDKSNALKIKVVKGLLHISNI